MVFRQAGRLMVFANVSCHSIYRLILLYNIVVRLQTGDLGFDTYTQPAL